MRVLYIANSSHIGGGNRSLLLLASGLRSPHAAEVVVPGRGKMYDACVSLGHESFVRQLCQPSWRRPLRLWRDTVSWFHDLRARGINLVHANDPVIARPVLLAARVCRIPVVVHVRYPPSPKVINWVFRGLPKPSVLLFNSHALKAESGPAFARSYSNVDQVVVHNAVNLNEFCPEASKKPQPKDPRRVGIVANLVPVKGHDDFLRMAAALAGRGVKAEYWIVGTETVHHGHELHLKKLSKDLGIEHAVRFLGHCADVHKVINQLDLVVSASTVEPFGRCLIEAMACAKPVVATAVGGIPEVVVDGVTGLLVPPRSPELLANTVERLLLDEPLRRKFGENGLRRARQFFSSESHVAQILRIYEQLLVRHANTGGNREVKTQHLCA